MSLTCSSVFALSNRGFPVKRRLHNHTCNALSANQKADRHRESRGTDRQTLMVRGGKAESRFLDRGIKKKELTDSRKMWDDINVM